VEHCIEGVVVDSVAVFTTDARENVKLRYILISFVTQILK